MVGQTKIENFIDNKLNDFFFSFVSNKLIFIFLVDIFVGKLPQILIVSWKVN